MSSTTRKSRKPTVSREERAEAIKAIHDDLENKVASLTTSDDWIAALDVAAKFHHYSLNNVFLLAIQAHKRNIELAQVAGFKAWQKLGRQVRKGEESLKVLAPAKYKVKDEAGEDRWVVRGFTTASVFDISQTDGEPLPEVKPRLLIGDGSEQAVLDQVVALIEAAGFAFSREHIDGGANGFTDFEGKRVVVRDDVTLAQALKTSVHEYAHCLLHAPEQVTYAANRPRCEVEAESVAYVVLAHLGIEADEYSLPYVAGWSQGDTKAVRTTAETVVKTAHVIIEALVPSEALVAA